MRPPLPFRLRERPAFLVSSPEITSVLCAWFPDLRHLAKTPRAPGARWQSSAVAQPAQLGLWVEALSLLSCEMG